MTIDFRYYMKPIELTKKQMVEAVQEKVQTASIAEYRWMYAYLNDLEEWPVLTDYSVNKDDLNRPLVSGEECPF